MEHTKELRVFVFKEKRLLPKAVYFFMGTQFSLTDESPSMEGDGLNGLPGSRPTPRFSQ
jgi:hypothetical protein